MHWIVIGIVVLGLLVLIYFRGSARKKVEMREGGPSYQLLAASVMVQTVKHRGIAALAHNADTMKRVGESFFGHGIGNFLDYEIKLASFSADLPEDGGMTIVVNIDAAKKHCADAQKEDLLAAAICCQLLTDGEDDSGLLFLRSIAHRLWASPVEGDQRMMAASDAATDVSARLRT